MTWVFAVLIVIAMGVVAAVAAGRGGPLAPASDDRVDPGVPATGTLGADDLRRVRFPIVLRGYRMADVDALLDRLGEQLAPAVDDHGAPADRPVRGGQPEE